MELYECKSKKEYETWKCSLCFIAADWQPKEMRLKEFRTGCLAVGKENFMHPIYAVCARLHINARLYCTSKLGLSSKHKPQISGFELVCSSDTHFHYP